MPAPKAKAIARAVATPESSTVTMGRIVHYDGCPALVQHVNDDGTVDLAVFGTAGLRMVDHIPEGDGGWTWPARV